MENQERKKIRVRIVKASLKSLWYADMIGREFEAIPHEASEGFHLFQVEGNQSPAYIRRDDCEVIPEESKPAGPTGREEGAVCNRNGCPGKIVIVYDPERRCACHINPPCSRCMDSVLKCDQCGAEPMEEEVRETLAIPEAAPADEIQPDETWPGFNGLQAYRNGDFPDGMIPFFMQGDLGKFEQMYSDQITLLSVDDLSVVRNLLSAIWHFGNDQWGKGKDFGRQEMAAAPDRVKAMFATGEKERLYSVMVAAAEYLKEEWEKLVDDAGCGPANLVHRLENCIAELYPGYTAGAFEEMGKRQTELEGQIQRMERTLEESAARADGLQNELDGAREYAVALKEQVAIAQDEAKAAQDGEKLIRERLNAAALRFHMVNGADEFHAISKFMNDVSSILCGAMMPRQEWKDRAILEELLGKLSEESAKWEHRGRKAEFVLQEVRKAGNWLQKMRNTNPNGRDLHLMVRSHLADLDRAFGFLESPLPDPQEWADRAIKAETRLKHADSMLEFFRRKNMKIRRQILQALLQARDSLNDSIPEGEMNAMNVFQLLNVVREHLGKLGWIANLPTTEENLQPVSEATIPEALIGFVAWMTARPQAVVMGGAYDATAPLECVHHYMKVQGFDTAAPVTFDQIKPMKDFPVDIESPYFIAPWDVQRNEEGGVNIKAPKPFASGCSNDVPVRTICQPCGPMPKNPQGPASIEFKETDGMLCALVRNMEGAELFSVSGETISEVAEELEKKGIRVYLQSDPFTDHPEGKTEFKTTVNYRSSPSAGMENLDTRLEFSRTATGWYEVQGFSPDGTKLRFAYIREHISELSETLRDLQGIKITEEIILNSLVKRPKSKRLPSVEQVVAEFAVKGPGGNPAETKLPWRERWKLFWANLRAWDQSPSDE